MNRRGRPPYPDVLTPREWQVLDLLRERLTNEEIAARLDVTHATAKFHVSEIIAKLGVSDRREAAAWQRDDEEGHTHRWLAGIAPLLSVKRLPFAWLPKAAAGAVFVAVAAGIALLAWGVLASGLPASGSVTAISTGANRTCALKDGAVWCWGTNDSTGSSVPVPVPELTSGVSTISTGAWGSCALKEGGVWCWAFAEFNPPPVLMPDLAPIDAFSIGGNGGPLGNSNPATCIVRDGGVFCRDNVDLTACQSGDCTYALAAVPGLASGVSAMSVGDGVRCAVKDGGAWCWGSNWAGQLGNHSTTDSLVPVPVSGLASDVSAISAGDAHVCALKAGGVWCWGVNRDGQLGNNSTTYDPVPAAVPVSGLGSSVSAISAGGAHTCALKDGGVWCWGRNAAGQLGDNSTADSAVPVAVTGLGSGVSAISAGTSHTCAVTDEGIWCWGRNAAGQLGTGRPGGSDAPVAVSGLATGVSVIEGTCALKRGGVWCWGPNGNGQVGNNTTTDSALPVAVSGLTNGVSAISIGFDLRCALKDGGAWCWGNNGAGQLGIGTTTDSPVPVAVAGLTSGVTAIEVGPEHVCAIKDDATWCWGSNRNGEFGADTPTESHQPVPVAVRGLPLGERNPRYPCYLAGGGVSCSLASAPMAVAGLETGVSAFDGFCALKGDGVWCFGIEGDFESVSAASPLPGLETGVSALSGGCALKGGAVWCGLGNAGGGAATMPGLASGVTSISNNCALKDGGVWCWGSNSHGELGNNSPADSAVPVAVQFPPTSASDAPTGSNAQPSSSQASTDSDGHRTAYVLAGTAAAVLAIVVVAGWAMRRSRNG